MLLVGRPAFSQPIPAEIQRELQRVQERDRERAQQLEETFRRSQETAPKESGVLPDESAVLESGQCVPVTRAEIVGLERYGQEKFTASLRALVSDCTPVDAIDQLLRTITNLYIKDGFISSRAVIVSDELQNGVLKIIAVEGVLDEIQSIAPADQRAFGKGELALAFFGLKQKQLNLRRLEQGIDQLTRLRSAEATIDVVPSSTPGASNLIVKRRKIGNWIRPNFSVDNDGSHNTGRIQGTLSLDVDSPLGLADYWSFYYSRDLHSDPRRGNSGFGGFVSLPLGYTSMSLSAGRSSYDSILQSNNLAFVSGGNSTNGSFAVDQLLFRDGKTKISLEGKIALLDTENSIQGIRLSTNSYRLVTASINARLQRRLGKWFLFGDIGYLRGLDILGANAADLGPAGPQLVYDKLVASINVQSYLTAFGVPFLYSASVRGAAALDPVLPAERFNLGGRYTIRGFRDDGISGRAGAFMRHDWKVGLFSLFKEPKNGSATQISMTVGYDAGGILPRANDPFERGFLQSSSLGLQMQNRRLQAELSVSAPLSAPSTVSHNDIEFAAALRLTI